jgi:hypothetical protein
MMKAAAKSVMAIAGVCLAGLSLPLEARAQSGSLPRPLDCRNPRDEADISFCRSIGEAPPHRSPANVSHIVLRPRNEMVGAPRAHGAE